ncbi:MAG: hypothetical protein DMD79_27020, partial [Candidatus Rokuibacteriota bacterium]
MTWLGVSDLVAMADGTIVAVGSVSGGWIQQSDIDIARYTTSGVSDPTFGTNGETRFDSGSVNGFSWGDDPYQVAVMPDGSFMVAARRSTSYGTAPSYTMALRFTPTGQLDQGFNGSGWRQFDFTSSSGGEEGRFMLADFDGRAVLGSLLYSDGSALVRLNPDG